MNNLKIAGLQLFYFWLTYYHKTGRSTKHKHKNAKNKIRIESYVSMGLKKQKKEQFNGNRARD